MYIDIVPNRNSPPAILLRETRRQGKRIVKVTLANLSSLPPQRIDILRRVLKGELDALAYGKTPAALEQGTSYGALWVAKTLCDRLGITNALGNNRHTPLVLLMIAARLLEPGSKLATLRWSKTHAVKEILGLEPESVDENRFYRALSWLDEQQTNIEQKLFRSRYAKPLLPELFLYDITSSYLEGSNNELADYGYNRDQKSGKKQIVIGLLTDINGAPLAVRVLQGNTGDTKTVSEQISILAQQFEVQRITLVGDKGMLRSPQIQELTAVQFYYIDNDALLQTEMLDGCYVIKSDLPDNLITAAQIHDRYKDLSKVERAFRTMKTGLLEIRPLFLRRADHTRGHVFMVMLSYLLAHEIDKSIFNLDITVSELMHDLDRICLQHQWLAPEVRLARLPQPSATQTEILQALALKLPEAICVPSQPRPV